MALPEKIRTYRRARGYTFSALADEVGVGLSTVTAWANGSKRPSIENLVRLAKAFQMNTTERVAFYESAAR